MLCILTESNLSRILAPEFLETFRKSAAELVLFHSENDDKLLLLLLLLFLLLKVV